MAADNRGPQLRFGAEVEIVKLNPDGSEAATYNGTLVESPPGWAVVRATWTFPRTDIGCMVFEPEDYLLEYFSTVERFNAFALFSPEDEFKGWYCNVTHPVRIQNRTIYWHDLIVDVIQRPDGEILIMDEDELDASQLRVNDPDLYNLILTARDSVVAKMRDRHYPFSEFALPNR